MKKLKRRWGIDSNLDILLILVVFSVTGSASVFLAKPVLQFIGLEQANFSQEWWGTWSYWSLRLLLIFPIYQILLLLFGWIFGQFRFFWKLEKKMLQRMGLGFILNRSG